MFSVKNLCKKFASFKILPYLYSVKLKDMYKELRKELEMENEKHFKLLKDDSIEINGVKLYRIEATKDLP